MDYEVILQQVGENGIYQKQQIFLLCFPALFSGLFSTFGHIELRSVKHRCAISNEDRYTPKSIEHEQRINASIPYVNNKLSSCLKRSSRERNVTKCHIWVFDQETTKETVVKEFSLVCDNKEYPEYADTIYSVGKGIGCFIAGILGDWYGRKIAMVFAITLSSASNFGLYFVDSMYLFTILRMICAIGADGAYFLTYVLGMEMVCQTIRIKLAICFETFWNVGGIVLGSLLYMFGGIYNWRNLQMVLAVINLPLMALWWLVPESPRWLMASGRISESEEIMQQIAKVNGKQLPPRRFSDFIQETNKPDIKLMEVMLNPIILKSCLILLYNFFILDLIYQELSQNTNDENVISQHVISTIAYCAGCFVPLFLGTRIGRRSMFILIMISSGALYLLSIIPLIILALKPILRYVILPCQALTIGAFITSIVYSSELFPTVMRCSGMGIIFMAGRLGNIGAPYVFALFQTFGMGEGTVIVERVIIGIMCILGGILGNLLVETLDKKLPEDLKDIIAMTASPVVTEANSIKVEA